VFSSENAARIAGGLVSVGSVSYPVRVNMG